MGFQIFLIGPLIPVIFQSFHFASQHHPSAGKTLLLPGYQFVYVDQLILDQ
jgi:hypothetical protein